MVVRTIGVWCNSHIADRPIVSSSRRHAHPATRSTRAKNWKM